MASSKPFSLASRTASVLLRYWPEPLAVVGKAAWCSRVQEEIVARMPFSSASGPR
jgi:hypothetical protein